MKLVLIRPQSKQIKRGTKEFNAKGFLFSAEKGKRQWKKEFVRVGIGGKERVGLWSGCKVNKK